MEKKLVLTQKKMMKTNNILLLDYLPMLKMVSILYVIC